MAVLPTHSDPYAPWHQALDNLEQMRAVQKSDDGDLWQKYNLLPDPQKYLIASRFSKDDIRWYLKSERKLIEIFHNSFKNTDKSKIRQAINKAIEDQNNIVIFQELHSVLTDASKSDQQKVETCDKIVQAHKSLFFQIEKFLCNFYGKEIKRSPGTSLYIKMVETMILKVEQGLDVWY